MYSLLRYQTVERRSRDPLFWLVMLLGVVVLGAGIGLRDPWPVDEPRFALIAREMVHTGRWLFPHVAGVLYPDKPPLFIWSIASLYAVIGNIRLSFLLPSFLSGMACLWLIYDLGTRLWQRRVGALAALALLLTLQFTLQAKRAQIDAMLCLWTTLALYGLCRHLLLGPAWRWYWGACVAMGLGVITKGVGFLPLLVLLPWAWGLRHEWHALARPTGPAWRWALGPVLLLATIGAWLVPMLIAVATRHDPALAAYRDNILFHQTAERYGESWHHLQPVWFYLVNIIPVFWLPLSVALPWLIPAWYRRWRRRDARFLLLLGWVVLVLIFFTASPGKRGVYLLPAVPALALAAGPLLPGLIRLRRVRLTAFWLTLLPGLAGLAALTWLFLARPGLAHELEVSYAIRPWAFLWTLSALPVLTALVGRIRHALPALAVFLCGLWLLYGLWGYPLVNDTQSARDVMTNVARATPDGSPVGLIGWREQMVLQARQPVVHFGYRREDPDQEFMDALAWLVRAPDRWLLLKEDRVLPGCLDLTRGRDMGMRSDEHWLLVNQDALTPSCREMARRRPVSYRTVRVPPLP
ncbi:MAG: glycosyltransferase family 39 protein [Gammaproteobacteria bacterium]|jgi:4-amino-4-deoxy-L-arabinose transferase-like glycosyltransferase